MKKLLLPILALSLAACGGNTSNGPKFPKPGTVVAQASQPIKEDELNHSTFSIKVIADTSVDSGIYDIQVDYGANPATAKIVLPKGCEDARPDVRKGAKPYSYIVGFRLNTPKDTTFYDYYEVVSNPNATNMRYIKSYSF